MMTVLSSTFIHTTCAQNTFLGNETKSTVHRRRRHLHRTPFGVETFTNQKQPEKGKVLNTRHNHPFPSLAH